MLINKVIFFHWRSMAGQRRHHGSSKITKKKHIMVYEIGEKVDVMQEGDEGASWVPAIVKSVNLDGTYYIVRYLDLQKSRDRSFNFRAEYIGSDYIRPAKQQSRPPNQSDGWLRSNNKSVDTYGDATRLPELQSRAAQESARTEKVGNEQEYEQVIEEVCKDRLRPLYRCNCKNWFSDMPYGTGDLKDRYEVGEKVGVKTGSDTYGYRWFPATVVGMVFPNIYVVEYDREEEAESDPERSQNISVPSQDVDRSLEDTCQEHLPLIPLGFESMDNAKGFFIHDSLLDDELTNGSRANRNRCVSTDHAAIQVAKSSQLMDAPMLSLDHPIQQGHENYRNVVRSHSTVDNSKLRRCSVPSHLTLSPISGQPVPIVKTSPVWPVVEGSDVYKLAPQQPHFLPLQEYSLELREGMALGLMVAFIALVENIREASIEESMEFFEDKIKTLCHLETYGFNVQFLQSRLTKMLQIKSNCSKYLGEIIKLKAEIVGKKTSLSRIDALLDQMDEAKGEFEQLLAHLRQEAQQIENDREHEDAELSRLKSKNIRFVEACGEVERQFQNILDDLRSERLS